MSDGSISQDEIDALLAGVDMGGMGAAPSAQLKDNQVEALTSYIKANLPALKSNLESMTGETLGFESPAIEIMQRDDFLRKIPEMVVATVIDFNETLVGDHIFIMTQELAQKIVSLVNHEENADLDEMSLSVISETISQHVGIELTALEKAGFSGVTNNPAETVNAPKAMIRFPQQDFVVFTFPVTIGEAAFSIWEIMSYQIAMEIAKAYGAVDEVASAGMGQMDMTGMPGMQQGMGGMQQQGMPGMQQGMGGMQQQGMPGMQQGMGGMQGQVMGMNQNVQSVQFPNLQMNTLSGEQGNIGLIMDVFMEMTVELGRTRKVIKEILGMGEGTIIELDKLAGEPVDILVNHKPIAKGEVVVIDENFGVRVTEILSPIERVSEM